MPRQLIFYRDYSGCAGRNISGVFGVLGGFHHAAQEYLAVIAIDNDRRIMRYSVLGQRAFYLGYQEGVVGTVG